MKYGYVFTYEGRKMYSEIEFAKNYFDFLEITIKNEKKISNILRLKNILGSFKILGHLDWRINLSEAEHKEIKKACSYALLFKKIGAKKITIHPSSNEKLDINKVRENNLLALSKIADFCRQNKMQLLIENITTDPFNRASEIEKLLTKIPYLGITLDIGHAYKVSKLEVDRFLMLKNKVGHIHLHDVVDNSDHLFFQEELKLKKILEKIKNSGYDRTISLECFNIFKSDKVLELNEEERRSMLVNNLGVVKSGVSRV